MNKTLNKYIGKIRNKFKSINWKELLIKIKLGLGQYKRVLKKAKKPSKEEFIDIVKITGLGIVLIGVIGYLIQTLFIQVLKI